MKRQRNTGSPQILVPGKHVQESFRRRATAAAFRCIQLDKAPPGSRFQHQGADLLFRTDTLTGSNSTASTNAPGRFIVVLLRGR